ncbi:TonB-dependent receptor family protein [Chromohalobacter moromii]|uniref:TonB-dependent receptor n=1 Tax=Chromohalobacter moromii TaxID=2860329 RepID=A0A9X3AXJ0_9GAMM|nr:TonB-dependent receptor [Chromohalobacter moromii]MCK2046064.1 TonB-dependent receptor [Chromohalobacter moromii]MCT8505512.1 TonB-dependent receptor [Chromohalobacter moromii]
MTHRYLPASLLLGALSASGVAFAQTTSPEVMEVTAPRLDRELYATPAAVSVVDHDSIAQGQQRVRLDESLVTVPGVFLQNRDNFAQGERLAIRGFGARAPFGVRGVTVMTDGIPYTLPDGQAQLDAIDLDSAERIEVIRGPSSVLYGNAAGGVLSVTTADGRDDQKTRLGAEIGSDGYQKYRFSDGGVNGPWSHHVSVSALNFDGYREQSQVEKYHLNAKVRRELGNDRALTAIVNLLDNPRSEDPGGLTREQVNEDRDQAGDFTEEYDTGQNVDQQVLGLQYEDLSAGPGELYVKGFYLQRDFEQQLPYPGDSLLGYQRDYYGGSAEYHQDLTLGELPLRYVVGVDVARQEDDRWRRDVEFDGTVSGEAADETQEATSVGIFAQGDLDLTDKLTLSLGTRYDRVDFDIDDDFGSDGDQSGERTFREWSGSVGLSYRYLPTHQVYANTGTSFETPTFSEFANPTGVGGFNPSVEPQKAWNREIGLRGNFDNGVDYDLALFSVRVRDELVPYNENGRDFYRNAGDSSRDGIELALGWQMTPSWRLDSALTLASYEFDEYDTQDGNYGGNRIPGLPEQTWMNQLTWQGFDERFATLETQYIGDMVADDANEVEVDDYWLVNLRAGDGWHLGGDTLLKGYVGVRNLFDREHFANVRINANNDRYFEPASGRTVYAGMEVAF